MDWKTFWFETNSAWGLVDSPEAWEAMRENWNKGAHGMQPDEIYSNNLSFDKPHQISEKIIHCPNKEIPNFGRRAEHIGGKTTLGEFFDQNGMNRN